MPSASGYDRSLEERSAHSYVCVLGIPREIPDWDLRFFSSHFQALQARRVACGREKNAVFFSFKDRRSASLAISRLKKLPFLGVKLRPRLVIEPPFVQKHDPISSRHGIIYPFSPHLFYKYPHVSSTIAENIMRAINNRPEFYLNVLNLMNRMNIPPPFSNKTSSTKKISKKRKMKSTCNLTTEKNARLTLSEIKDIPAFANYECGKISNKLFIKNVDYKNTTSEDLEKIYAKYTQNKFTVRLFSSGRMRGQAFVHFASNKIALQALKGTNGLLVNGSPLIVQFGEADK